MAAGIMLQILNSWGNWSTQGDSKARHSSYQFKGSDASILVSASALADISPTEWDLLLQYQSFICNDLRRASLLLPLLQAAGVLARHGLHINEAHFLGRQVLLTFCTCG
jgi:hypothetical protein